MPLSVRSFPQRITFSWRLVAILLAVTVAACFWPDPDEQAWTNSSNRALPLQTAAGQAPGAGVDLLDGGTAWLNTSTPLTMNDLRGRVVLLDFWTLC